MGSLKPIEFIITLQTYMQTQFHASLAYLAKALAINYQFLETDSFQVTKICSLDPIKVIKDSYAPLGMSRIGC